MTFLVAEDGRVYERDLGEKTVHNSESDGWRRCKPLKSQSIDEGFGRFVRIPAQFGQGSSFADGQRVGSGPAGVASPDQAALAFIFLDFPS